MISYLGFIWKTVREFFVNLKTLLIPVVGVIVYDWVSSVLAYEFDVVGSPLGKYFVLSVLLIFFVWAAYRTLMKNWGNIPKDKEIESVEDSQTLIVMLGEKAKNLVCQSLIFSTVLLLSLLLEIGSSILTQLEFVTVLLFTLLPFIVGTIVKIMTERLQQKLIEIEQNVFDILNAKDKEKGGTISKSEVVYGLKEKKDVKKAPMGISSNTWNVFVSLAMISWAKKENGRDGKIVLIQGTLENPRIYIIVPDTIRRPPSNDDPSSYPASKQDRLQEQQHLQNYNQISESDEDYREMGSQS